MTPTNEEVRRQFEAEHRNSLLLERRADGQYASDYTQAVFAGYQAALSSHAVVALVEALKDAECELACQPRINSYVIDKLHSALALFTTGAAAQLAKGAEK